MKSLASKTIAALAAVALPALAAVGLLGSTLITTVDSVDADVTEAMSAARRITEIRVMIEREYGLVARLPAELDQAKIDSYVKQVSEAAAQIQSAVAALASNDRIMPAEAREQILAGRAERAKVIAEIVDAAKSFSQTTALDLVNGPFEANTRDALRLLDKVASNADAVADAARGHLTTSSRQAWTLTPIAFVVVALACILSFWMAQKSVVAPLKAMAKGMHRLSAGDLSIPVEGSDRADELGEMARALQVFKDALIAKQAADASAAAAADAKMRRAESLDALTKRFQADVSNMIGRLSSAAAQLETTAQTLNTTATATTDQSLDVSTAAEQASTNVESVAAATNELTGAVTQIAERVSQASSIAAKAVNDARQTDTIVKELAVAAEQIDAIVALISTIAGQTNLLALNATIEAARAGEAGRGFAVVASEVKALANQTTKATGEIASQIAKVQSETAKAVSALQEIGATIDEVNAISVGVAAAIKEQGAVTSEISHNVQQAAVGTRRVSESIVEVKHGAGATGRAASEVLEAARALSSQSAELGRQVEDFLAGVHAA
jgi:methyl-accepting chemotaxis protein